MLIVGPLLRHVGETTATIWVEVSRACSVSVSAGPCTGTARTFQVKGHHYAIVVVEGLEPGSDTPYSLALDDEVAWPTPEDPFPGCSIRTLAEGEPVRLAFGSCRLSLPHEPPYTLPKDEDDRGRGKDALWHLAARMRKNRTDWPDLLLLLGDQVYADEVSPGTLAFIRSRRDIEVPPGKEVADFEEYTRLYWDSWQDPGCRWLLSTVATAMIFDDHDIHDDWNASAAWLEKMREKDWWEARIIGAMVSYWIYQHLGNLSPAELASDDIFARVQAEDDAWRLLSDLAHGWDREPDSVRWSFSRDLVGSRLVVIDSRAARAVGEGSRKMVDDAEWKWVAERCTGEWDHLLIATSIPLLLAPGMHHLEAWNEAICAGAWGKIPAKAGERLRQAVDLEHWGAFNASFRQMRDLLEEVGAGESAPASIVALSGDVHHAYLAEVAFRRSSEVRSAVYQAVCSPVRNPLSGAERAMLRAAGSRVAEFVTSRLARASGVPDPGVRWRLTQKPTFDNQIAGLVLDGRSAHLRIEKVGPWDDGLECTLERTLA